MKARLIIKGSVLHAIDVNERTLQMSFLYKVAYMHQLHTSQRALNSQMNTRNMTSPRNMCSQIIIHQQSSTLLIHTVFDWNLSSFSSVICEIDTYLPDAVMVWREDKYLASMRNLLSVCHCGGSVSWHFFASMMTSSNGNICRVMAICAGNSLVTGEFPIHRPVTRSFDVSLICAWINGWVNNREAGDLRRHRAHYDVIVMEILFFILQRIFPLYHAHDFSMFS